MNDKPVVVVTGGSRGIGKAIVLKFAEKGFDSALIYSSNAEKAQEVSRAAGISGAEVRCYKCNVADFSQCKLVVNQIYKDFGRIDVLVNNAGIHDDKLIFSMDETSWDSVINTNLKGTFNMIKHASPFFLKQRYGKIINISSVAGIMGNPGQSNYSASKAGIIGLTKTIARELAGRGICCNAIAPGIVDTDMTSDKELREKILSDVPLKRVGTPDDIAKAALFLGTSDSDYITGTLLQVDGGLGM